MSKPALKVVAPSSHKDNICTIPGCYRPRQNFKLGVCKRCASSFYYYRSRYGRGRRGAKAIAERRAKYQFYETRLGWLFGDGGK